MRLDVIEIRLRFESDPYKKWEDRPVIASFTVWLDYRDRSFGFAVDKVKEFMAAFEGSHNPLKEVRWNWVNSPQGHYIST